MRLFFFLMIRRPPRSTHCISSAASDVYKRQVHGLNRFTKELLKRGHQVEVFVSSHQPAETIEHQGVLVHRVPHGFRRRVSLPLKWAARFIGLGASYDLHVRAWRLAQALEKRHTEQAYDVVQAADYLAVGLYLKRRAGTQTRCEVQQRCGLIQPGHRQLFTPRKSTRTARNPFHTQG
eukprot:TRINITY_DN9280_c0_g1_i2.p2 TRINITY_DN9280_c0_g1~~TRINITY_DN9280_c0_g1_i2.p2  ORF type:complete len:178 (-),score=3.51 TRINITY_DN9280_c0_g1_i2:684-1217(-)